MSASNNAMPTTAVQMFLTFQVTQETVTLSLPRMHQTTTKTYGEQPRKPIVRKSCFTGSEWLDQNRVQLDLNLDSSRDTGRAMVVLTTPGARLQGLR